MAVGQGSGARHNPNNDTEIFTPRQAAYVLGGFAASSLLFLIQCNTEDPTGQGLCTTKNQASVAEMGVITGALSVACGVKAVYDIHGPAITNFLKEVVFVEVDH